MKFLGFLCANIRMDHRVVLCINYDEYIVFIYLKSILSKEHYMKIRNSFTDWSLIILLSSSTAHGARNEPISPIEIPSGINMAQAELGKKLFFDPRLSKSGFISCNSCHNLSMGGTDNIKTSIAQNM